MPSWRLELHSFARESEMLRAQLSSPWPRPSAGKVAAAWTVRSYISLRVSFFRRLARKAA